MEIIDIKAEKSIPRVYLNAEKNEVSIEGRSYMENPQVFYEPIILWMKSYLISLNQSSVLVLKIDYLNTSSTKMIMDILDLWEKAFKEGKAVSICWYYDPANDFGLETGEEYKEDYSIPFELKEKQA